MDGCIRHAGEHALACWWIPPACICKRQPRSQGFFPCAMYVCVTMYPCSIPTCPWFLPLCAASEVADLMQQPSIAAAVAAAAAATPPMADGLVPAGAPGAGLARGPPLEPSGAHWGDVGFWGVGGRNGLLAIGRSLTSRAVGAVSPAARGMEWSGAFITPPLLDSTCIEGLHAHQCPAQPGSSHHACRGGPDFCGTHEACCCFSSSVRWQLTRFDNWT